MLWSLSYHISPIHCLLPISYNLSFHSLGCHPTSLVLTSFWLHECVACTWHLCLQTKISPLRCIDQATKFSSHPWAQTMQVGKIPEKENSFQIEGQIFILPFKNIFVFVSPEKVWVWAWLISVILYHLIINVLMCRVLTYASWHFPRSWPEVTQGHYSQEAIWTTFLFFEEWRRGAFPVPLFFFLRVCPLLFLCWSGCSLHPNKSFCTSLYPTMFKKDNRRSNFLLGWTGEEKICYSCHQPFLEQKM